MTCHGNPDASVKAPEPAALRQMTPEAILGALTTGVMQLQGQSLADEEKRQVAESLAGRPLGTASDGDAATMPNRCPSNSPLGQSGIGAGVERMGRRRPAIRGFSLAAPRASPPTTSRV